YRGHEIKGGTHGFLRSKAWHLTGSSTEGSGASLKYQITPEDFSPSEYPLKVSVDLTYQIYFFQAGDGIRFYKVTGVQTCALPISCPALVAFLVSATRMSRTMSALF